MAAAAIVLPQPRGAGLADDELPSLHVATCISANLIAVVFDKKIILCRLKQSDGSVETLTTWPATQRLRSVSFLHHQASRKLLLLVAGDGKLVQTYDVLLSGPSSQTQISLSLVHVYGPHHKKISCVAAADNNVVLADKFGEVYQIHLEYDEATQTFFVVKPRGGDALGADDDGSDSDNEGNKASSGGTAAVAADPQQAQCPVAPRSSATFLLQHFSLITQLTLTNAVPRRLITCDREAHVRVSKYPNTCIIEQFLWNVAPQSPVTSVVELHATTCDGMVLATGDNRGRVAFWCDGVASSKRTSCSGVDPSRVSSSVTASGAGVVEDGSLRRVGVVDVHALWTGTQQDKDATMLGVVGLAYLHMESADKHGVLVALDHATDLFYIPIRDGGFSIEVCASDVTRVALSHPALGVVRSGVSSALILQRGNAETSHCVVTLESDGIGDSCRIQPREVPASALATEINALGVSQLDVFAHWRPAQAKDPRTRPGSEAVGDVATTESQKKKLRNDAAA